MFPKVLISAAVVTALALGGCGGGGGGGDTSPSTGAQPEAAKVLYGTTCKSGETLNGIAFNWCAKVSAQADTRKVLYLFHGAGGNEHTIMDSQLYTTLLAYWTQVHGVKEPVLIAVSFGPEWTLTELPSATIAGAPELLPLFVDQVMPYLEGMVLGTSVATPFSGTRYAYGGSMGGYNLAQVVIKRPAVFSKALFHCPGFFTVTPYSTQQQLGEYILRNSGATVDWVNYGLAIFGADTNNLQEWNAHDPIQLGQQHLSSHSPKMMLTYNMSDEFGFEEGTQRFIEVALERGATVEQASTSGGHCWTDSAMEMQMAEFLR